jgi:anti-anti-sigma regulatory factor
VGTFVDGAAVRRLSFDQPIVATSASFEFTLVPTFDPTSLRNEAETTENDEMATMPFELATFHSDAELRLVSPAADKEMTVVFSESAMIGRASECDLRLSGREISRRHCIVFRSGSRFRVRRLSKVNSVCVNDQELAHDEAVQLRDGDIIRVASQELLFFQPATSRSPASEASASAAPNLDLNVELRTTRDHTVAAFDIVGFLGIKTFPKLEAAILPSLDELDRVILDLGYLVGLDSAGVQSLARVVAEADRREVGIQFIRVPPRVSDILSESPLKKLLQPLIAGSEDSAIKRLRR